MTRTAAGQRTDMLSSAAADDEFAFRRVIEADDGVAVELTLTLGDGSIAVEAVVIHRWADDRIVDYRLDVDPVPG